MKKYMLGMGMLCAASLAAAQTPKAEQAMDTKRQHIAAVAALTGRGDLAGLESALAAGLDDGMTVNELKEVMVHAYAYCGFPRALRGLQTLVGVLDGRKAAGVEVNWGREASPVTDARPKYERGRDILAEISGIPADAPKADYAVLAPEIEVFLKEHLFADLFERDVLTHAEREIATVAILAAVGGVEPMMKGHMGIALNTGVAPDELRHLLAIVERRIGRREADAGRVALDEVLQSKGLLADSATPVVSAENGVQVRRSRSETAFASTWSAIFISRRITIRPKNMPLSSSAIRSEA